MATEIVANALGLQQIAESHRDIEMSCQSKPLFGCPNDPTDDDVTARAEKPLERDREILDRLAK